MKLFQCFLVFVYFVKRIDSQSIEDGEMNFTALAGKYGQAVEEHEVTTDDGYVLTLFRIPGKRKKPVLLMHGLTDSADTFVIRGNQSMGISLAYAGYDVWVGNIRGNRYSRRHLTLNPDKDMEFWDYSFHEGGYYDLPAMIDYILQTTGEKKLQTIGHSQGTTMHFVLLSKRPEYNEKIKIFIALAPAVFLGNIIQPWTTLAQFSSVLNDFFVSHGIEEAFSDKSQLTSILRSICSQDTGYEMCFMSLFSTLLGYDAKRIEPSFVKVAIEHAPTGTSRKSFVHYGQLALSKRFCEFDYGSLENLERYNHVLPPDYNLRAVSTKVAILVGRNDPLARIKDIKILRSLLPNVMYYHVMKPKHWNHIDFIWANDMAESLLPSIFQLLEKYEQG